MTKEHRLTLVKWLGQQEREAIIQAEDIQDNADMIAFFKERASQFRIASAYYKSLRCKAPDPAIDDRMAEDPAGVFQQCLRSTICKSKSMLKAAAKDDIRTRIRCYALSGALLEVSEFLNAGRNQGQE